ncbi:unnamed protein product [Thlaspi arvense]|uniref:F-box protein n=1 Tax=Thlaspi arvense TaxID=13288 RepID=A0AAU9SDI9_THLAR|nr:unnamed protein product [Thlaspi arvense]
MIVQQPHILTHNMDLAWQAMPVLLRNCPHLATLVLKGLLHRVTDKCGDSCICISPEEKGRSLVSCPVKRLETRELEIYIKDDPLHLQQNPNLLQELMRYNESGLSPNVNFKVHESMPLNCTMKSS